MTNIRTYLLYAAFIGLVVVCFWGESQARARVKAETSLNEALQGLAAAETALAEQEKQHDRWIIAVMEREKRLAEELSEHENILCEMEEVKKDDQTAADFGAAPYHPAYLERLRRNAP